MVCSSSSRVIIFFLAFLASSANGVKGNRPQTPSRPKNSHIGKGGVEWPVFFEKLGHVHSIHNKFDLALRDSIHQFVTCYGNFMAFMSMLWHLLPLTLALKKL
jgi:hypothetical protein